MSEIALTVNGKEVTGSIEPRTHLADFIREKLNLTGTHLGCEHGVCGACTIRFDGAPVRACLIFAVQADGHAITTVEGLAPARNLLSPLQQAWQLDIIHEERAAAQQSRILVTGDGVADMAGFHPQPRIRCAASSTASTMCW